MKIAFQAQIPHALFDDPIDCLHRVVKPMVDAIRKQARDEGLNEDVRISVMVDTLEPKHKDPKAAIHEALADGTVIEHVH